MRALVYTTERDGRAAETSRTTDNKNSINCFVIFRFENCVNHDLRRLVWI